MARPLGINLEGLVGILIALTLYVYNRGSLSEYIPHTYFKHDSESASYLKWAKMFHKVDKYDVSLVQIKVELIFNTLKPIGLFKTSTLDYGINVPARLLIFWNFSSKHGPYFIE